MPRSSKRSRNLAAPPEIPTTRDPLLIDLFHRKLELPPSEERRLRKLDATLTAISRRDPFGKGVEVWEDFGDQTAPLGALDDVRAAKRYVLLDDFTEAAARLSMRPAAELLRASQFARPPFRTMWIEWNNKVRCQHTVDSSTNPQDGKRGILISTMENWPETQMLCLQSVLSLPPDTFYLPSMSAHVTLGPDAVDPELLSDDDFDPQDVAHVSPLGMSYAAAQPEAERDAIRELCSLFQVCSNVLRASFSAIAAEAEMSAEVAARLGYDQAATEGDGRFALAVLSLLSNPPEVEVVERDGRAGHSTWIAGKFIPPKQHKTVTIERPSIQRAIMLFAGERRHGQSRRPEHDVEAHWCYSHRYGDPDCPHDEWTRHVNRHGQPLGKDMWKCLSCGQYRWRRKDHKRGDPTVGVIEKDYAVHASAGADLRRPPAQPPGQHQRL